MATRIEKARQKAAEYTAKAEELKKKEKEKKRKKLLDKKRHEKIGKILENTLGFEIKDWEDFKRIMHNLNVQVSAEREFSQAYEEYRKNNPEGIILGACLMEDPDDNDMLWLD